MTSTHGIRSTFVGLGAAVALLLLPAAASGNVYCVDVTGGDCTNTSADFPTALTDANNNPGPDTIRLGPMQYNAPEQTGFVYGGSTDPVSIIGSGQGMTTIATTAPAMAPAMFSIYHGLRIQGVAGSSLSDLTVTLPTPADTGTNQQYRGVVITAPDVDLERVTVSNPDLAIAAFGVTIDGGGNATLSQTNFSMPSTNSGTTGLKVLGSTTNDIVLDRSVVSATIAIDSSNDQSGQLRVRRSTLLPEFIGLEVQSGTAHVENTLIDLGASDGAFGMDATNLNPGTDAKTINADHVTIVGGGMQSVGFRVRATAATAAQSSTGTLTNSVISGPETPIRREASNDGTPMMNSTANVTTNFSNYNAAANFSANGANGAGAITEANQTNFPPGFVGGGDFHLAAGSMLIDIGDPTPPAMVATDIDGDARAVMAIPACAPRRDIGADEFMPMTPVTPLNCAPAVPVVPQVQTPASENPECAVLRAKLKKAKSKRKKRKIRKRLRQLGC